jgi:2,4-dienoyl-CoA reductase-like NADH-dependent reductase (Old Yellow Enzyme family)/thioredoxin reductase
VTAFDALFSPLAIGPVELRNRIVSTAHQTTLVHDHLPTDDFVAYHEARARGGVGLIVMEACAVHPSGLLTAHTLVGYREEIVGGYRRVGRVVQPLGTRLFIQLFHAGREQIASAPRPVAVAPSAIPSRRYHVEPRALRDDEIEDLIEGYARSAAFAAEGGLDGVEITAAHNYLPEQFFREELNERDGRWSEGIRFLLEVIDAVRRAAPTLAVGVRLSADSEAAQAVAGRLAGRVDYLHVALGDSATYDGCLKIVPPPPIAENAIASLTEPFKIGVPLVATSRVLDPREADRLIREGRADAFGMNRALITDPDLPRKAREGRLRDLLRCIGCNACIAHYHAETPIACAQNPRTGRERTLARPVAAASPVRIVVVGAGPAGLAAAAEAGAAGHEVIVLEERDEIGGQLALAAAAPMHAETAASLRGNYARLVDRPNVELRLRTPADADLVAQLEPDAVVVATGAHPYRPRRLNVGSVEVVGAWEVLAGARPEGPVVVWDWGGDGTAMDCAELLQADGIDVTLAVGAALPGETLHQYVRNVYLGRLSRAGVPIAHFHDVVEGRDGEVVLRNVFAPELETTLPARTLVLSLGRVPRDTLTDRLAAQRVIVEAAGDCRSPRGLEEAILEGTLAAREAANRVAARARARAAAGAGASPK